MKDKKSKHTAADLPNALDEPESKKFKQKHAKEAKQHMRFNKVIGPDDEDFIPAGVRCGGNALESCNLVASGQHAFYRGLNGIFYCSQHHHEIQTRMCDMPF